LAQLHRFNDAAVQFEEVLRLDPNYPHARENLAAARQLGQNQPSSNGPMQ
jgi:Flp pilus assembly protein TadD